MLLQANRSVTSSDGVMSPDASIFDIGALALPSDQVQFVNPLLVGDPCHSAWSSMADTTTRMFSGSWKERINARSSAFHSFMCQSQITRNDT